MINKYGEKIPNLFIVGAPKCGTTSLHYWLSQHPEIFMSNPKEPWYFCTDLHKEADNFWGYQVNYFKYRNKDNYLSLFKNAKNKKILGESSPRYLFSKEAANKIFNFNQNAKIIITIRNPIDFIHSWHAQMTKSSFEPIENFERAIKKEQDRKKGYIPKNTLIPSELIYTGIAQFSKFINHYFNYFDRKNVKIILLDDIKDKPKNTYQDILEFLEVNNINFTPEFEIRNPNIENRLIFLKNFIESSNYQIIKKPLQKILPKSIRKKMFFTLKNKNTKVKPRKPMNPKLKRKLKEQFKPEVEKLSKLLNRDLITLWKYDGIYKK